MRNPQPGLFAEGLVRHHHVEFRLKPDADLDEVRTAVLAARRAATWLGGPNVMFGFSPTLWEQLNPGGLPDGVHPFEGITGTTGHTAPVTQWDIWVWAGSYRSEDVQEVATVVTNHLDSVANLELSLACYKAVDSRDPTGFIDGTENPLPDEAYEVAVFPEGAGHGGSAVFVQQWVHNLTAFFALAEGDQEKVFGRTRRDSIQYDDETIPFDSHVKRNTIIGEDGEEQHIYRRNTPYSNSDATGTQFIGATNDVPVLDLMLDRMFGASGDGFIDHLIDFTTPKTGSWYFVPAMEDLTETFGPLAPPDDDEEPADGAEDRKNTPISDETGAKDIHIEIAPIANEAPVEAEVKAEAAAKTGAKSQGLNIGSLLDMNPPHEHEHDDR